MRSSAAAKARLKSIRISHALMKFLEKNSNNDNWLVDRFLRALTLSPAYAGGDLTVVPVGPNRGTDDANQIGTDSLSASRVLGSVGNCVLGGYGGVSRLLWGDGSGATVKMAARSRSWSASKSAARAPC